MTEDPHQSDRDRQRARGEELRRTHQGLRTLRADVAEAGAAVHDDAARVHEELGEDSRLDPAQLRAHADADRAVAAEERAALDAELAGEAEQRD